VLLYPSFGLCVCVCVFVCVAVLIIKTAGTAMRRRARATNRLLIHLIQTHPDELLSASCDVAHTQRLQFRVTLIIGELM